MKLVKRALLVALALAMALSAAACGGNGGSGSGSGGGEVKPADTSYIVDGKINNENLIKMMPTQYKGSTIKFYNWYDPYKLEQEGVIIDEFQEKFGVKVEMIYGEYNMYNDYLAGLMATGDAPDVMRMLAPSAAMLQALQPIKNTGFVFDESVWSKYTADTYTVDGVCYGVNLINTSMFIPYLVLYNTDTMKNMGFDDPYELWEKDKWTWDAFASMCRTWVKQGSDYYGCNMWPRSAVASSAGKSFCSFDGKQWKFSDTDKTLTACWQFTLQGIKDRIFGGDRDSVDATDQRTLFAICDGTGVAVSSTNNYMRKLKAKGKFGFAPIPRWKDSEYYVVDDNYLAYGVCKGCANPGPVPYFLAYYLNLDNYNDDGKQYFINDKAAKMMEKLRTEYKRSGEMTLEICKADQKWFPNTMFNECEPGQIATYIETWKPVISRCFDIHNEVLKNLEK